MIVSFDYDIDLIIASYNSFGIEAIINILCETL